MPPGTVAGFADATGRFLPLVCTLNATKVTDAVARLLGVGAAELDAPRAGRAGRVPGAWCSCRTSTASARRTGPTPPGLLAGIRSDVTREQLARAAVEGVVCNLLAGADHLPAADGRVVLVGGGARSAGLPAGRRRPHGPPGRRAPTPTSSSPWGRRCRRRRCSTGAGFDEVAAAWSLGEGEVVEPDPLVDGAAVRAVYAEVST